MMSGDIIGGLSSICLRYGIDALYVFGSRAPEIAGLVRTGQSLPDTTTSDVGIGVQPYERERVRDVLAGFAM